MKRVLIALLMVVLLFTSSAAVVSAKPEKPIVTPKLEKVVLVHYDRPEGRGKPEKKPPPEPVLDAYELIGPKWEDAINVVYDPDGAPMDALAEFTEAYTTWDDAVEADIFGSISVDSTITPSTDTPDLKNGIFWRMIVPPRAIALTIIWWWDDGDGIPEEGEKMADCDVVMNTKKDWGIDPDGEDTEYELEDAFDIRNIAVHEAGHVFGLGDLYEEECYLITMYGYSSEGEVIKRSLQLGDELGIDYLY